MREAKQSEAEARPDLDTVFVKIWRTVGDDKVRASHQAANGQIRLGDEPFTVGGAELREPRDPQGPPEEVINCRCQMERVPVISLEGEERRRAEARAESRTARRSRASEESDQEAQRQGPPKVQLFTVWAAPGSWGPWKRLDFRVTDGDSEIRFEMSTVSNVPSGFEPEISFFRNGERKTRRFTGPGSFTVTIGGDEQAVQNPRFRLRSFSVGQNVRVKVIG